MVCSAAVVSYCHHIENLKFAKITLGLLNTLLPGAHERHLGTAWVKRVARSTMMHSRGPEIQRFCYISSETHVYPTMDDGSFPQRCHPSTTRRRQSVFRAPISKDAKLQNGSPSPLYCWRYDILCLVSTFISQDCRKSAFTTHYPFRPVTPFSPHGSISHTSEGLSP